MAVLVPTAGKAAIAALIKAEADYLALGTGTTAEAASDTTLGTEITDTGLARAQGTMSTQTTNVADDTSRATKTWTATGSKTVGESGLLTASSGGTLYVREVKSPTKSVTNGDTYTNTTDLVVS